MARTPVREVSGPSEIRGVAAPVNTFVRPADPAPSSLHQLAEGLAAFDSGLGSFLEKRKGEQEEADKQRALRDSHLGMAQGYDEGTKRGLIPAHESPSYIKWYNTGIGERQGRDLYDKAMLEYQTWDGRNKANPDEFKAWLGDFYKRNVGDISDPHVLAGINPQLDRIESDLYSTFTTERSSSLKHDALSAAGANVMDTIDESEDAGIDRVALWGKIKEQRSEALLRNSTGEVDAYFVDAILTQAEEAGDEELLGLLDNPWDEGGKAVSSDPEVRKKVLATQQRIESGMAAKATTMRQEEERKDKERHNALLDDTFTKINEDPSYIVPEETLKELSRRDPEFRTKLGKYRRDLEEGKTLPESQDAITSAVAEIDKGAGRDYVHKLREKGVIKSTDTFKMLLDRAEQAEKARGPGGILQDPAYKAMEDLIKERAGAESSSWFGGKSTTVSYTRAMVDFRTALYQWESVNTEDAKDPIKRGKAIQDLGERILGGLPQSEASQQQETGEYVPLDQRNKAPTTPEGTPEGAPPQQQGQQVQQPPGGPIQFRSTAHQQAVQTLANKRGISTEEAYKAIEEFYQGEPGGTTEAPQSGALDVPLDGTTEESLGVLGEAAKNLAEGPGFSPLGIAADWVSNWWNNETTPEETIDEGTRNSLTELLKNPPKLEDGSSSAGNTPVGPLLDLIGHTEGTDRGAGYNETLGYGAFTGGKVNLEGMTLDQIDQLQTKMLSHPDNSLNSSAVGRYQIIRTTLRDLRRSLGLSGDELYDRKMQDRLGMALLERRGLSMWKAGRISDEQFMKGLSAEWASLPKADGKGTYRGQRVGANVGAVRGALEKVRGTQVASLDPSIGMPEGPIKSPATALEVAKSMEGLTTKRDHATIAAFIKKAGIKDQNGKDFDPASLNWCAAFINSALFESGQEGSGSNLARSFLDYGEAVEKPAKGDIVVFSRSGGEEWGGNGHVGFVVATKGNKVQVLGGNQGGGVTTKWFSTDNVLGYRRIKAPKRATT